MALPTGPNEPQRNNLRAIETRYRGFRFRSRLEARWAVFFDAIGAAWEYEPEGFQLHDGQWYLPDFRIHTPQGNIIWYEIKPTPDADSKMQALARSHRRDDDDPFTSFVTLGGDPYALLKDGSSEWAICPRCGLINKHDYGHEFFPRYGDPVMVGCGPCDFTTSTGPGEAVESGLVSPVRTHKGYVLIESVSDAQAYLHKVLAAAEAARSARFEHGEAP